MLNVVVVIIVVVVVVIVAVTATILRVLVSSELQTNPLAKFVIILDALLKASSNVRYCGWNETSHNLQSLEGRSSG